MIEHRELQVAIEAAHLAGKEIMGIYEGFEAIATAPSDISTEADMKAQEIILQHLLQEFPKDAYCAEESTPTLKEVSREGDRLWVIDPIDGTRGFARKTGEFSVMIAFLVDGRVRVGVVYEPAINRSTFAVSGKGCWCLDGKGNEESCQVSTITEAGQARIVRSRTDKSPAQADQANDPDSRFVFTYSAGIKLAMIARGDAEIYVSRYHGFNSWDISAGHILVEEAGGQVIDQTGKPITYQMNGQGAINGIIAHNGHLLEYGRQLIQQKQR